MNWGEEVAEAYREVVAEYPAVDRAMFEDVRVEAWERFHIDTRWGAFFYGDRHIEIYRPAFDLMPDPENRAIQLRDVLRHELDHALGRDALGHTPTAPALVPDGWLSDQPMDIRVGGVTVSLP